MRSIVAELFESSNMRSVWLLICWLTRVAFGSDKPAGDVDVVEAFAPGIGEPPRATRMLFTNSVSLTSPLSCSCSWPWCMTTKVGGFVTSQKAARNPASVDPACKRNKTAFCDRRVSICVFDQSSRESPCFVVKEPCLPSHSSTTRSPTPGLLYHHLASVSVPPHSDETVLLTSHKASNEFLLLDSKRDATLQGALIEHRCARIVEWKQYGGHRIL